MVDRDVLRRQAIRVAHHVARLRARPGVDARALSANEDLWQLVLMDLVQAIQACIDLATHVVADERLGISSNAAHAFDLLARAGRIDAPLAQRLAGASGLRNLIVHQYADLDHGPVLSMLADGLDDLEAFVAAISRRSP
ncbi:MAG: DUF86 domain-containing protein [Deltaproteobacteria bacterium]|nr:DUF86 domain-containing protein [Deltaproteobacteria bacterium]